MVVMLRLVAEARWSLGSGLCKRGGGESPRVPELVEEVVG
jgi:hypothetical protein